MEPSVTICVLTKTVSFLVPIAFIIFLCRLRKIIMIHKVISRVIRRVYVYHLDLAHIGVLKQLQNFEVIALDIEILCRVPIHTLLGARTQCLVDR